MSDTCDFDAAMDALDAARALAEHGVPVFRARPALDRNGQWVPDGGHQGTGYWLPTAWQETGADPAVVDEWQPGDALCLVTGEVVDVLDVDTQKGGSLAKLGCPVPRSLGRARTPSGGTHDLITTIGVRSRDAVVPGVDLKAGVGGLGRGFIFIAPTVKLSKVTGELASYRWEVVPDLDGGPDVSGEPLRALIAGMRSRPHEAVGYNGPAYEELPDEQQELAAKQVEAEVFDLGVELAAAAEWGEGERDGRGRGWERLATDAAWHLMCLALRPWTPLDLTAAEAEYERILPAVIAENPTCTGKWTDARVGRAAAEPVKPPPWVDPVFDATPLLAHVRAAAHARTIAPKALLACVLARVAAEIPFDVCLPAARGSRKSLNVGVALVGPSGSGKSSAWTVSRELLGVVGDGQQRHEKSPGSGEGLVGTFLQPSGAGKTLVPIDPPRRRLFWADEIAQVAAVKDGRSGSTLGPVMRSMLTGEPLGQENAELSRRRYLAERSYRAVLAAGVQPGASGALLNPVEVELGTPQRFIWALAQDPGMPWPPPAWPGALGWAPPSWGAGADVGYPEWLTELVQWQGYASHHGRSDGRDGHDVLARLKVAAYLAALHGETELTEQWWALAGHIADGWRAETQEVCYAALRASSVASDRARGESEGRRRLAADELVDGAKELRKRTTETVLAKLDKAGEDGLPWSKLRASLSGTTAREAFDTLLGTVDEPGPLVESGQVRLEETGAGRAGGRPGLRLFCGEV